MGSIISIKFMLNFIDFFIVIVYFLILFLLGYVYSKRQNNTDDYFKGGGRVPSWAAGVSIFGTVLSPITFLAIPSKTYSTDWSYFMFNMTIFIVAPIIILLFIPFFRKLNIVTAYEYLEKRFDVIIRVIGSVCFIIFQVGRMGVILFLPSIVLNLVMDIDIFFCIFLMGLISLIYTLMGGIEAVIWTDVMQVIVLSSGVIISLVMIISSVEGGFSTIFKNAIIENKFNLFDLTLSLKEPTLWVMLIGGFFTNIATYGTDHTIVQRYLVTKDINEANKSVWINAILSIPASVIFFFVGTALFVYFKNFPNELSPDFILNDAIFPWYIITQLPNGFSGLMIAAIFAAAMSSLSSSMNSAAASYLNDIHLRFRFSRKNKSLKIARLSTLIIGLLGIFFAFFMASYDIKSLWDEFNKILGLVIGSLGGVFLLGVLTKKANSKGVLTGLIFSFIFQLFISSSKTFHLLMYSATGVVSCFVIGYIASLVFNLKNKN